MLAVQGLQRGDVLIASVCDEALEAVPVRIGERELRAGGGRSHRQINQVPRASRMEAARLGLADRADPDRSATTS